MNDSKVKQNLKRVFFRKVQVMCRFCKI